jgi:hypothetical protein
MASFQMITLLGGYKGFLPPPNRKRIFEEWSGNTAESVPPVNSVDNDETDEVNDIENHA